MIQPRDADPAPQRQVSAWLELERAEKVPEIVAGRVLRTIVGDGMVAGDRLPSEASMLEQYGVGRASLREALRILETHGLIRIKPGPHGGPVVADVSARDYGRTTTMYLHRMRATFQELREARQVVEPMMARLAAERLTDATAQRLRDEIERGWEAIDRPSEVWSQASAGFHAVLAGATGNRVLDLYGSALISIERRHTGPAFVDPDGRRQTMEAHERIADAILDRDGARAEKLTLRHGTALGAIWREQHPNQLAEFIEWR